MIDIPDQLDNLPKNLAPAVIPNYQEPEIDDRFITRGEWIWILMNELELNSGYDEIELQNFYGYTQNDDNGKDIEIANLLNILLEPESGGYIDPVQDVPLF